MHLLDKLEEIVKRDAICKRANISYTYLSSLKPYKELPINAQAKIKAAVREIIKELKEAIK